jgi:hypothetical protein
VAERNPEGRRRFSLELSLARLEHIDALKKEWGLRNRGDVLERLLENLFGAAEDGSPDGVALGAMPDEGDLDEQGALVLVGSGGLDTLEAAFERQPEPGRGHEPPAGRGGGGIDLPGFVRRRSDQLKRSLRTTTGTAVLSPSFPGPLPQLSMELVEQALKVTSEHWLGLYGKPANETVLEAAMIWLAQDIWPQSDPSEGRPFTWTVVTQVMREWVPGWGETVPDFERVIVIAGVLEDPFSGSTLPLRIPTLIRRFVHRFRRRRSGTSFQTLENTMTLQGALRLLELPTDPGHRVTLAQIREAYRERALTLHPDAGGSAEAMRRLNEAYQLLKELYRHQGKTTGQSVSPIRDVPLDS